MRAFYLAAVAVAGSVISCWSPNMPEPKSEPNPLDEVDTSGAAPANVPPPPKRQTDPDLDFLKDMAHRGAEQALKCDSKENKGPREVATVNVTFEPRGWSGEVTVDPPHQGTPMGECIARAFQKLHGSRFEGEPIVIHQQVDFATKKIPRPGQGEGAATKSE